jgi:Mg2+/Co2+ transporter CorB
VIGVGNLIGVVIGCVVAQAFFVGAELALATCNRVRLRQRAEAGDKAAKVADRMMGRPQVTLATTLLGANLAALLAVLTGALHLWRSPSWCRRSWCWVRSSPRRWPRPTPTGS